MKTLLLIERVLADIHLRCGIGDVEHEDEALAAARHRLALHRLLRPQLCASLKRRRRRPLHSHPHRQLVGFYVFEFNTTDCRKTDCNVTLMLYLLHT